MAVVLFSFGYETPYIEGENCYQEKLAFATPYVINRLNDYITDYEVEQSTNYKPGLRKAFSYFEETTTRRTYAYTCTCMQCDIMAKPSRCRLVLTQKATEFGTNAEFM